MMSDPRTRRMVGLSAATSAVAGLIHFWLVPIHWYHSHAHAIFFAVIGVAQVLWANEVWRNPTSRLYYVGAIMSGWLIVLYVLTRLYAAPFGHGGPEDIDALGLTCKACELAAMLPLMILIFQGELLSEGRRIAWETTGLIVIFVLLAAVATYTVARAAEPYFPALGPPMSEPGHDEN